MLGPLWNVEANRVAVIVGISEQIKQGFILRVQIACQGPRSAISIQSAKSHVRIVIRLTPIWRTAHHVPEKEHSHVAHGLCGR